MTTLVNGTPCTHTSEYRIWSGMVQRCTNPKNPRYSDYGGRGIGVHQAWRESFVSFLADIGPRPTPNHSVDRIDNDRGYEPGNVRWATPDEQANNRRRRVPAVRPVRLAPVRVSTCPGQLALREWMESTNTTQSSLGRTLELSQVSVAQWIAGPSRPEHHVRIRLHAVAGIDPTSWMTDAEYAYAFGHPRPAS